VLVAEAEEGFRVETNGIATERSKAR